MRIILFAFAVVAACLSACADPPASEDDKTAAAAALYACFTAKIGELDDGRSDASTVAFALSAACGREFVRVDRTYEQGEPLEVQAMLANASMGRHVQIATSFVLEQRRRRG